MMDEERKRRRQGWWWWVIALPVFYVLLSGPAVHIIWILVLDFDSSAADWLANVIIVAYWPLIWVSEHNEFLGGLLESYRDAWDPLFGL